MLRNSLAVVAAASLATTPAMAASSASSLSIQPPAHSQGIGNAYGRSDRGVGNPFGAPGAGVGITLFGIIIVLGVLLATGVIFDDDDDRPIST